MNPQVQGAEKKNPKLKKTIIGHIIIKLLKISDKEKNKSQKAARGR